MDFAQIPVYGQSVKAGLGFRFRGNYWAFFDKRTELSPWLALHRESINDTELDELLLFSLALQANLGPVALIKDLLMLKIFQIHLSSEQICYLGGGDCGLIEIEVSFK